MVFPFKFAEQIDPIAVLALILSVLQMGATIIKWRINRKKIIFKATPDMVLIGGVKDDKKYISFKITNIGDKLFTIRSITITCWPSKWDKIFKHNQTNFYVNSTNHLGQYNTPATVEVGKDWDGLMVQTSEVLDMLNQYAQFEAHYSLSARPIKQRVQRRKQNLAENKK